MQLLRNLPFEYFWNWKLIIADDCPKIGVNRDFSAKRLELMLTQPKVMSRLIRSSLASLGIIYWSYNKRTQLALFRNCYELNVIPEGAVVLVTWWEETDDAIKKPQKLYAETHKKWSRKNFHSRKAGFL